MRHLPAYAVAVPFLVAAALTGAGRRVPRRVLDVVGLATAGFVLAACLWLARESAGGELVYWFGGWRPRSGVALGIAFVVDPLGAGLAALAATLVAASLAFSWRFFDAVGALYHSLMLVFLGGMVGFCLTGDLFNLFVFFELISVAAYALTGYKVEEEESLVGALNFAVVNSLGSFFVLAGIGLLYGRTGALNLAQVGRSLAGGPADGLVAAAFVLLSCGFLVKGAVAPFHFWLPDAHAVAPTPVSVLFSGVMVELGLYAVARVYWAALSGPLGPHSGAVGGVLLGLGALTAVVGGVMCLAQRHLKRLLAFSTVSHMGIVLIGVALFSPAALAGTAVYVVGHGLVKGSLFLGTGVLLHRRKSVDEVRLRGLGRGLPVTGAAFGLAGLGLAGLPPFATHPGKALIEGVAGARGPGFGWVAAVLTLASALTAAAVLRAGARVFLGWGPPGGDGTPGSPGDEGPETRGDSGRTPLSMVAPMVTLVALALACGLAPGLSRRAVDAASRFVDREGYAARVLDGRVAPPRSVPASMPTPPGAVAAVLPSAAAVALALAALAIHRLPTAWRESIRGAARPVEVLRALHSGRVGDYVTWLVVGVAVVGGLLAGLLR